jgi:hypothetical protein
MAFYFPRPELARHYAAALSDHPLTGMPSGLFLSAPRRTGKSTFLRRDLRPVLEARGDHVIYVDLWADRSVEPAAFLAQALADSLRDLAGLVDSLWSRLPFRSVKVAGVQVDLDRSDGTGTGTLSDVLLRIAEAAESDVVLIIDEAQDLYGTASGKAALFALKAARDAMNQRGEGEPALYLVLTGSNRDKLSNLVTKSDQAFYGASVTPFPVLGRDFVEALVADLNGYLAEAHQLDPDDVEAAFALVNHRPELLDDLVRKAATSAPGLKVTLRQRADDLRALIWDDYRRRFDELTPLQQALLRLLAEGGPAFRPYAEETLARLGEMTGRKVRKTACQKAMKALRDAGLIWQAARSQYATEERDMRDWLLEQADPGVDGATEPADGSRGAARSGGADGAARGGG